MESPQCGVDPLDYSTRLPPRKRLLANLKKQASPPELPTVSLHFNSAKLRSRVQELLESSASFPEEGVQVSKSIVSEAEEVAAGARALAMEKALVAVRAKAFARSVLEVVASLPKCVEHEDSCSSLRVKDKKKQIPVRHLYDSKVAELTCANDGDLAGQMHQSMDRSPRMRRNSITKKGRFIKTNNRDSVVVCAKSSSLSCKLDSNGIPADHEITHSDTRLKTNQLPGKNGTGMKSATLRQGKKVGIRRKKLPLSQFGSDNNKPPIVVHESKGHSVSDGHESDPASSPSYLKKDDIPSTGDDVSDEKESPLNFKRLKLSQVYSGKKILRPLGSKTTLVKASAVV